MFAQQQVIAPDRATVKTFLNMLFGYCEAGRHAAPNYSIVLRGLGEKGTPGEGVFNEAHAFGPLDDLVAEQIMTVTQRWSAHGRATFIVPAAVDPAALLDRKATEDRILSFGAIMADIDKGDTEAKLAHAEKHLGQASMVVHSGGITEDGKPKLHAYWRLTEPTDKVSLVAAARKMLALKIGGDAAFGRCTQIIRLPGSLYGKGGVIRPVKILREDDAEYDIEDFLDSLETMQGMAGIPLEPSRLRGIIPPSVYSTGKGLDLLAYNRAVEAQAKPPIADTLNSDIAEGGEADRNRWSEFSRVAGFHIHQARNGIIGLDRAAELTMEWAELHMKPLWPQARIDREWRALVDKDVREKGAMPARKVVPMVQPGAAAPANPNLETQVEMFRNLDGSFSQQINLGDCRVSHLAEMDTPKRKFLVEGLIQAAKSHLLVAEGGAGKTYLLLDLAVKIAMHEPGRLQSWCGMPLTKDAGGTVVMFTTEDDIDEVHIRIATILQDKSKWKWLTKFIILPMLNLGGAFALVERERAQGPIKLGSQWAGYLKQMAAIPDLRLVIIDTLNTTLHGEENNATIINEYMQAASADICGKLHAALVITHHVRKPSGNVKIYSAEDMKASIRGSTALVGGFRVVLGIWHAPDFKGRLTALHREPKPGQLYNFAVVKANNPEMAYDMRALLREPNGLLLDITDKERQMRMSVQGELGAWAVFAVTYAAEQGHPFTTKAAMKRPPNGRKNQLPAIMETMTEAGVQDLLKGLVEAGRLVQCNPKGRITYNHLDIPDGPLAKANGADGGPYRIAEGSDFTVPNWEQEFAYHAVEGRIVKKGEEDARMV